MARQRGGHHASHRVYHMYMDMYMSMYNMYMYNMCEGFMVEGAGT